MLRIRVLPVPESVSTSVLYVGTYDGEGTFSGHWQVGGDHGLWLISMNHRVNPRVNPANAANDIQEIVP